MSSAELTQTEMDTMALSAQLWNHLCSVVGIGPSRDADLAELAGHIHSIQHAVLAQAAARAYPQKYRLLGEFR